MHGQPHISSYHVGLRPLTAGAEFIYWKILLSNQVVHILTTIFTNGYEVFISLRLLKMDFFLSLIPFYVF